MAVPASPATAVAGPLAASLLNSYKTNIDWVIQNTGANRPYCHAYQNTGQAVTTAATTVTLDSEIKDTDSMHTGSNGFFTVNTSGLYLIIGTVAFPGTTGGSDKVSIVQNGATALSAQVPFQSASHHVVVSGLLQLAAATDTITLQVTAGSAVTLQTGSGATFMQAFWMSL